MRRLLTALLILILILILVALLARPWWLFQQVQGAVPAGVQLAGGMDLSGADAAGVTDALERAFEEPIAVYYAGQRLVLRPQAVGFRVDANSMLAEALRRKSFSLDLRTFLGELVRHPPAPINVPLRYTLDAIALDNWLADVADHYDRSPIPPQPVVEKLTLAPGQPGLKLDLPASRERVLGALIDPKVRGVELVVHQTPAPPIDMKALEALLKARMDEFPGIGGVFVHQTATGAEAAVNGDVAYAGMSTIKIAIVEEVLRKLKAPPDVETTGIITRTTALSDNHAANQLLGIIGDGDQNAGVRALNQSLHTLGLQNTFMATPYDQHRASPPHIVTPANSRKDLNTLADAYVQTTPRDLGLMLEMIVECSQGGGTLLAAYGDQLTDVKCRQALDFLGMDEMNELAVSGVPEGTRFVHKHGYAADTHGDVAAIWGPAGPYIISVFIYQPPWLEWSLSKSTMKDLSTAVWNYFTLISQPQ
jgi:beta-lactamase class A